jgi:hypothetical protein
VGGAAALVVALGGATVLVAPAEAAPAPALTFVSALTSPDTDTDPVAAPAATPIGVSIRVENTSTVRFPIGRVSATLPSGFTVVAPSVSRAGWVVSQTGQTITARVARPTSTVGVLPGGSITISASVTNSTGVSEPTTLPVTVRAAGPFGLISLRQVGPNPSIVALPTGATAFKAEPGVPLKNIAPPGGGSEVCQLTPSNPVCSNADLVEGAYGNVYFLQRPCSVEEGNCRLGTEVELAGDFGGPISGKPALYSPDEPVRVNLICLASLCPHAAPGSESPESEPEGKPYSYNRFDPNAGDEREMVEDYNWYPVYVQLKGEIDFGELPAPPCVPADDLVTTGKVTAPLALSVGYCIDVNAITRSGDSFTGDLTQPVLFIEDPRMRR